MINRSFVPRRLAAPGFTLTELAIVIFIIALLLGGTVLTLTAQSATREMSDTQRTLELARDAVIGFAAQAGRLPCPAAPGATGIEAFVAPGAALPNTDLRCSNPLNGLIPALTLGIGPTDPQGYLIDAWGNRIRYAVSTWSAAAINIANCPPNTASPNFNNCPAYTTTGAMKGLGLSALPTTFVVGQLRVCNANACAAPPLPEQQLTFVTPAVIFSPGKNFRGQLTAGPPAAGGAHEEDNVHFIGPVDATFVAHEARPLGAFGDEFDDLVIWISPNILYNRLISAGAI